MSSSSSSSRNILEGMRSLNLSKHQVARKKKSTNNNRPRHVENPAASDAAEIRRLREELQECKTELAESRKSFYGMMTNALKRYKVLRFPDLYQGASRAMDSARSFADLPGKVFASAAYLAKLFATFKDAKVPDFWTETGERIADITTYLWHLARTGVTQVAIVGAYATGFTVKVLAKAAMPVVEETKNHAVWLMNRRGLAKRLRQLKEELELIKLAMESSEDCKKCKTVIDDLTEQIRRTQESGECTRCDEQLKDHLEPLKKKIKEV
jgi:hypothetical protein